jgi:hypothetical protein
VQVSTEELLLELRRRIIAPPQPTGRHLGRLGRRPRPAQRLARAGLAAPKISGGAVGQADPNDNE